MEGLKDMITTFSHVCKEHGMEGVTNLKLMTNKGSLYFGS
jgi:hypothetical protein